MIIKANIPLFGAVLVCNSLDSNCLYTSTNFSSFSLRLSYARLQSDVSTIFFGVSGNITAAASGMFAVEVEAGAEDVVAGAFETGSEADTTSVLFCGFVAAFLRFKFLFSFDKNLLISDSGFEAMSMAELEQCFIYNR